jgi:hypothetical protein
MQNKVYIYVNRPKKALKGNLHKAKGYYTNRGHLDQMVLAQSDRRMDLMRGDQRQSKLC